MTTICMIPARLGSTRIKDKAIRILGDRPLVQYAIDVAKTVFDTKEIYIDASEPIFKNIAKDNNVQFYERPAYLSEGNVTSNDFIHDFLVNGPKCDSIIQLNITSPFITNKSLVETIRLLNNGTDVVHSVKPIYAEAVFKNSLVNFDQRKGMGKSQDLTPVHVFTSGIMGFNVKTYLKKLI